MKKTFIKVVWIGGTFLPFCIHRKPVCTGGC